jgi:rsbT co-antagonist protein RsbR
MALQLDRGALDYERFFQTSGDLLFVLDPKGRFIRANEAFRTLLGYPEELLLEKGFVGLLHPEDTGLVQTFVQQEERDVSLRVFVRFLHANLSYRALSFSFQRVAKGGVIHGTGRDVAEQMSEDQRQHLALFSMLEQTALVGGWVVNPETLDTYWTDQTCRIQEVPPGYKPDWETGVNFYAPEALPIITAAATACMTEGKPYYLELELITATGRRIWVRAAGKPVIENGKVVRMLGAFQDIDSFKRREIELEEKLSIIQEQKSAIRALSAPIISVWDRVLALPVVGTLDEERAAEITGRLLDAVAARAAKYAILDLTGVETVDEKTGNHLVKIIRAIQLLGAKSIITGIRPAMAQTLSALGAGFSGARTVSNLQEAIKIAMQDTADIGRS